MCEYISLVFAVYISSNILETVHSLKAISKNHLTQSINYNGSRTCGRCNS